MIFDKRWKLSVDEAYASIHGSDVAPSRHAEDFVSSFLDSELSTFSFLGFLDSGGGF